MSVHDRALVAAVRGIAKHGRDMQVTFPAPPAEDDPDAEPYYPGQPEPEPTSPTTLTLRGLEVSFETADIDASLIESGDFVVMFDGTTDVSTATRVDGHSVKASPRVKPGEKLLLQYLHAHR